MNRELRFYEGYFIEFYLSLPLKVQNKIDYVFSVIRTVDIIPKKFLKHIESTNALYEIRVKSGNNIYRIFCCFDEGKVVVLFNAFTKKSQKTPKKEMEKALKLKEEYFNKKKGGQP